MRWVFIVIDGDKFRKVKVKMETADFVKTLEVKSSAEFNLVVAALSTAGYCCCQQQS